eukprot:s4099_g3.t3
MGLHVDQLLTVQHDVIDAEPGYLNVAAGDQVRILYIGSDERQDEHGWVFGATAQCKGWLSVQNLKLDSEDACEAIAAKRGALSKGAGYLRIRKGEPLIIKHEENEWLFGWSNEQQQQGWFPRLVLTKPAPPPEEEWEALQNKQKPQFDRLAASAAASTEALAGPESLPSWTVGRRAPKAPWNYAILDNRRRCFCGFLRAGKGGIDADTAKRWANLVKDGIEDAGGWDRPQGNLGTMSRFTKWLVRSGCSCPYRYGGAVVDATPFPPFMEELMDVVMPLCGFPKEEAEDWPNSCNVNLYADGTDYLDWHADDEPLFGGRHGDCCIISLSLGQERPFQLRLTDCADKALPLSAALPSTISHRLPELLAVWRLRSVCKAWHRATIRACLLRQDRWTTTELMRVSCSYFEGGGADFLARRLVFGPRHSDDAMEGEAQMIMVKGNTESREAPHEFDHSDGSYVCEILKNERAVLRIRVLRRVQDGSSSPEEHEANQIHEFPLGRGALCTMEGRTQQFYQHRVPKRGGQSAAARINLTWRWITKSRTQMAHDLIGRGKARLLRFYYDVAMDRQKHIVQTVFRLVSTRVDENCCCFVEELQ